MGNPAEMALSCSTLAQSAAAALRDARFMEAMRSCRRDCSFSRLASSGLLLVMAACGDPLSPQGGSFPHLWIRQTGLVIEVGQTVQLSAKIQSSADGSVYDAEASEWTSLNPDVASIDGTGRVQGLLPGVAVIQVEQAGVPDTGSIMVLAGPKAEYRTEWRDVDVGRDITCGLTLHGAAYCWGWDYWGAIGDGVLRTYTLAYAPVQIAGGHEFASISAGHSHVCALKSNGSGYCWGDQHTIGSRPSMVERVLAPELVNFGGNFSSLQSGDFHVCGIDVAGHAFCWGTNALGEIGDGSAGVDQHRYEPTPVAGGLRFSEIRPGHYRTCALDLNGRAYCWGRATPHTTPFRVRGEMRFYSLTGFIHACGLTADRRTWCWGENQTLQQGTDINGREGQPEPVPLENDPGYVTITAGPFHTCGIRTDGVAFCWGSNEYGQLGTTAPIPDECGFACTKTQMPVAGGLRFAQISAGETTTCGVTVDQALYCWGDNRRAQLGTGKLEEIIPVPTRVVDPF